MPSFGSGSRDSEILDRFQAAGVSARSILMGRDAFARWEKYGTTIDKHGGALRPRKPQPVSHLTAEERALYLDLIDASWPRVRRIEQERIPLALAHDLIAPRSVSASSPLFITREVELSPKTEAIQLQRRCVR